MYYTYKLLIDKLKDYSSVERLNIGTDVVADRGEGVWTFKFIVDKKPVFVLWYEDNINQCPICNIRREGSKVVDLSGYVSTLNVKITHIITEQGKTGKDAEIEIVPANSIKISETPIFVEEKEPTHLLQRNLRGRGNCEELFWGL